MALDHSAASDSDQPASSMADGHGAATSGTYQVIARRYRPQSFDQLIGQAQVAHALAGAIESGRIGHAYLFTGARGVGKTSTARILARCLNCETGPTATPCGVCEACRAIARGDDVDVLEIDGASNRGIDEIRQLRETIGVRPVRGRFKIFIIDEVHMLTREAFNALLKTLEEPPRHVKFFFCTTDPEKIPITVLSRCQRFDFPPVETDQIVQRLSDICAEEGVAAAPDALTLLARRAAGSVRDSQSLLEQVLSYAQGTVSEEDVYRLLGTARSTRVLTLAGYLAQRNAASALAELDAGLEEGADVGQIAEQLVALFRDVMVAAAGGTPDLLHAPSGERPGVQSLAAQMGLRSTLAALQILDQALTRMRETIHPRTVVETAIVRVCLLEDLARLTDLLSGGRGESSRGREDGTDGRQKKTTDDALSPRSLTSGPSPSRFQEGSAGPIVSDRPASWASPAEPAADLTGPVSPSRNTPSHAPVPTEPRDTERHRATAPSSVPSPGEPGTHLPTANGLTSRLGDPTGLGTHSASPTPPSDRDTTRGSADAAQDGSAGDETVPDGRPTRPLPPGQAGAELPESVWQDAAAELGDLYTDLGEGRVRLVWKDPVRLAARFEGITTFEFSRLERFRDRLEAALVSRLARTVRLDMHLDKAAEPTAQPKVVKLSKSDLIRKASAHPLIQKAIEVFDGEVDDVSES